MAISKAETVKSMSKAADPKAATAKKTRAARKTAEPELQATSLGSKAAAAVSKVVAKSKAVAAKPESAAVKPETAVPEPATAKPGSAVAKSELVETKLEQSTAKPEPAAAKPEPVAAKPEPAAAKPEPAAAKPGPAAAKPEPAAAKPEPAAAKPEPAAAKPKPAPAKPKAAGPEAGVSAATVVKAGKPSAAAGQTPSLKTSVVIEYAGNNIVASDIIAAAMENYTSDNKDANIETMEVYVKPEEGVAYYVVNGIGSSDYKVGI